MPRGCNDKAGGFAQRLQALVVEIRYYDKVTPHALLCSEELT